MLDKNIPNILLFADYTCMFLCFFPLKPLSSMLPTSNKRHFQSVLNFISHCSAKPWKKKLLRCFTRCMAEANEISMDAAVAAVLSDLNGIVKSEEEQKNNN